MRQTFEHPDPPAHELGTDKPGRVFASVGARRAAMESTDFHELAEEDFLKGLAAHLKREVTEHRIGALVLVAPPRALATLRRSLKPSVHKIVLHEVERDYVHMPMYEIEQHLTKHLAGDKKRS